ncbi:MAG: trigger factor [Oscillospiraceae bacterium]
MIVKNIEKKEHSTAMFQVEVEAEAFDKAIESAYRKAKGGIYVAGFRKGKAPRAVIEGMYGKEVFHEDAVQIIAPEAFEFGAEDAKLDNVGMPSLVDYTVGEDRSVTITFSTDVYPEIVLGDYKGLEAECEDLSVGEAQVDDELENTRKSNARFVDVDRPVQNGDTIVFDFEGFVNGEAFAGGKAEDYSLEIGSNAFIPGFEEQLVGMEVEKDLELNVTFPQNYDEKLAGKDATFKVRIHTVREPQYPELDDEFAKDVSEFDTMEEYRAGIRIRLTAELSEQSEREFHSALLYKAADNMTCDVPEGMVNDKMDEFLRNYADSMGIRGNISREDIIKSLGMPEETFISVIRPNALKQVQADLLLDEIIKVENIEVSQEEKDAFYKKIEDDYGPEAEKIREMISDELMVRDLARKKAAELIYSTGVKVALSEETPAAEEKTEEKPKPKTKKAKTAEAPAEEAPAEEKKPKTRAKKAKTEDETEKKD